MELEAVLHLDHLEALSDAEALEAIARLVDHAFDQSDLKLNAKALNWVEAIGARSLAEADLATLDYFRANIWADRQEARHTDRTAAWSWDQEDLLQQVFFLRRALNNPAFADAFLAKLAADLRRSASSKANEGSPESAAAA